MPFRPPPGFTNPHLQTMWAGVFRRRPRPQFERERIATPDGDFLDIDWLNPSGNPLVVLLHGLEGGSGSSYIRGAAAALAARGFGVAVMHFRGCSGEPNRRPRSYHSGETTDFDYFLNSVRRRCGERPVGAAGFSLGGNVLLRWAASAPSAPLFAMAAVSVPYHLARAADTLDRGFARFYQWLLLRSLKRGVVRKFSRIAPPFALPPMPSLRNFRAFDDAITAPLHGFADAEDYYRRCSSGGVLRHIRIPTLLLHAEDDPFTGPGVAPAAAELPDCVTLELSRHGGHSGFITGAPPLAPRYWLDRRLVDFFAAQHAATGLGDSGLSSLSDSGAPLTTQASASPGRH